MNIGASSWHPQHILAMSRKTLVYLQLLLGAGSLIGIGFFVWMYFEQNRTAGDAFSELSSQSTSDSLLSPIELMDLSHKACVLDSSISDVQSLLQPLSSTLSQGGWCGNYVRVFINFADQAGYPAHKFHIQSNGRSHTLAEVFYQGKWRIIDPFFNQVYLLPTGEMATFTDLRHDISLVNTPTKGEVSNPRLDRIFKGYEPIFESLYLEAPDFHADLSRSAFYHNIFVSLSYPLDPFYEGERRPILPAWLDRIELLGIYFFSVILLVALAPFGISWINRVRRNR